MDTAIDRGCSGNYFMLIFESPAFRTWKCDKGLSSEHRDLIEGLLRRCFVKSGKEGSCVSSPELLQVRSGPLRRSGVSPVPPPPGRVWSWDDPGLSHGWTQAPAALLFSVTEVTASLKASYTVISSVTLWIHSPTALHLDQETAAGGWWPGTCRMGSSRFLTLCWWCSAAQTEGRNYPAPRACIQNIHVNIETDPLRVYQERSVVLTHHVSLSCSFSSFKMKLCREPFRWATRESRDSRDASSCFSSRCCRNNTQTHHISAYMT